MVVVYLQDIDDAHDLLQSASALAIKLKKSFAVFGCDVDSKSQTSWKQYVYSEVGDAHVTFYSSSEKKLHDVCEQMEASFLFIQLRSNKYSEVFGLLKRCRTLRIPYVFYKQEFKKLQTSKVYLPVGFLEEELEKAQFASAFGRFCNANIDLYIANDYGTKAQRNAERMCQLFDKFSLDYTVQKATKDSFKLDMAVAEIAQQFSDGIVLVSASRDYGLDDILFGPKELHIIRKMNVPVLLVNPRGDLYALCD